MGEIAVVSGMEALFPMDYDMSVVSKPYLAFARVLLRGRACQKVNDASSVLFAAIQTAVFTVWAAMVLFSGHNSVDVTIVYAWIGATLQGQFAYIVGSLYHPARYTLPDKSFLPVDFHSFHVFAAVNLVIVALPLAVLALQQRK